MSANFFGSFLGDCVYKIIKFTNYLILILHHGKMNQTEKIIKNIRKTNIHIYWIPAGKQHIDKTSVVLTRTT